MWHAVRPYKMLRVIRLPNGNMFNDRKFKADSKDSKFAILHWYTLLKSLLLFTKYQIL